MDHVFVEGEDKGERDTLRILHKAIAPYLLEALQIDDKGFRGVQEEVALQGLSAMLLLGL